MPSQQLQGQLQTQYSVDTSNYIMNKKKKKKKKSGFSPQANYYTDRATVSCPWS
jgi:hypothetical protein